MGQDYKPKILRSISEYLSKSFKFYDLKGDLVAPAVFILILAVNFLIYYMFGTAIYDVDFTKPGGIESFKAALSQVILVFFATNVLVSLISAVYLYAFIKEQKGENYTLKECFVRTGKNSVKIILAYLAVFIYIPVYALLLRLPGLMAYITLSIFSGIAVCLIVLYFVFIFGSCYIQDKNKGLISSLKESANVTRGHKVEIFSIILIYEFISIVFTFFAMSFVPAQNNELVRTFVESFISSVFSLAGCRLTGLMYIDLE